MNYGWDDTARWTDNEKEALRLSLEALCQQFPDSYGMKPYVEVGMLYPGVRIRRITHFSDEVRDALVSGADEIYTAIAQGRGQVTTYGRGKSGDWRNN
jgi:hypothetical protein